MLSSVRWLPILCVSTVAFAWPHHAHGICGRPPDARVVPLPMGPVAPINTHVRATLHAGWEQRAFCTVEDAGEVCPAGAFEIVLRHAPGALALEGAIAVARQDSRLADRVTVTFAPLAPLAANSRFELVYRDRNGKIAPRILGTFATGALADTTAPRWIGVSEYFLDGVVPAPAPGSKVVTVAEECAEPTVVFASAASATDDQSPEGAIRYGLWATPDPAAVIEYSEPALAYLVGDRSVPSPRTSAALRITLPIGSSKLPFALPQSKGRTKVGIRAVDLAGNRSAPSELVVRLP